MTEIPQEIPPEIIRDYGYEGLVEALNSKSETTRNRAYEEFLTILLGYLNLNQLSRDNADKVRSLLAHHKL